MKSDGGGLFGFFVSSPSLSLMVSSKIPFLHFSVSEFSLDMLRGRIYSRDTIVALEVINACDISLPSFLMGTSTLLRHSFVDGN